MFARAIAFGKDGNDYFTTLFDKIRNVSRSNIEMGIIQMRKGEFQDASFRFRIASFFDKANPIAYYMLGKSYVFGGRRDKAIAPLKRALELKPDLNEAKFLLSMCGTMTDFRELPRSFIVERNDTIADNYATIYPPDGEETNFTKKVREEFGRYFENWQGFNVLELGCQGGEIGRLLRDKANALVGVEPSIKMAALARLRRTNDILVYNKVAARFAADYLTEAEEYYQVITAFQILGDFAQLEEFFRLVRSRIVEGGGVFFFSIHPTQSNKYEFGATKIMFQHNERYVEEVLGTSGFKLHRKTEIVYESGTTDIIYIAETI